MPLPRYFSDDELPHGVAPKGMLGEWLASKGVGQQPAAAPNPNDQGPPPSMSVASGGVSQAPPMTIAPPPASPQAPQQAQGAQPTAIPMVSQTQDTVTRTGHDPAAVRKLEAEQGKQIGMVERSGDVAAAKAGEIARVRELDYAHRQEMAQREANDEIVAQNRIEMANVDQQRMINDLAKTKKDPDRYWKKQGTGARIMAGIAVALTEFGRILAGGGRNTALDMINKAIDDDLDAQESEIQVKRDKISAQNNTIANLRAQVGDQRIARSMLRQHALEDAAMRIEMKAAASPDEIKQVAAQNAQALRVNAAEEAEKRKQYTSQHVKATHPAYTPQQVAEAKAKDRERYVPGANAYATSPEIAREAIKFDANTAEVVGQIKKLRGMVEKHGNESLPTTERAKMVQLRNMIMASLKNTEGLGAMSTSDQKFLDDQVADPTKFSRGGGHTIKLLDDMVDTITTGRLNKFISYGLVQE